MGGIKDLLKGRISFGKTTDRALRKQVQRLPREILHDALGVDHLDFDLDTAIAAFGLLQKMHPLLAGISAIADLELRETAVQTKVLPMADEIETLLSPLGLLTQQALDRRKGK